MKKNMGENMTVKEYLQQVRYYEAIKEATAQEIERLNDMLLKLNSPMDGDRVQSSSNPHRMDDIYASLEDMKAKLCEDIQNANNVRNEVLINVLNIPDGRMVQVLYKRYFSYMTWESIAEDLHVSRRWVTTIHDRALKKLSKFISS